MRPRGFTLPELLIVLTLLSTAAALGWSGVAIFRETAALRSAVRRVSAELTLARRLAVDRRETVRFGFASADVLALRTADGEELARLGVGPGGGLPVDSVRIAPKTLRFNARGQAAPGSVYLYRGRRYVRIVCNFLGRLRVGPVLEVP